MPILTRLASEKSITGSLDCGAVYLELLSQNWGQGIIEIRDEEAHGFRSGFCSSRATRSWRERIFALQEAGFIEIKPKASRRIGYILRLHPDRIIARLREEHRMDENLWLAYVEICSDFCIAPIADPLATGPRPLEGWKAAVGSGVNDDDDIPF